MSHILLTVVSLLYAGVMIDQAFKGNWPSALMFFGWTVGNVGIMLGNIK